MCVVSDDALSGTGWPSDSLFEHIDLLKFTAGYLLYMSALKKKIYIFKNVTNEHNMRQK